jgi:hypothetical protein
VRRVLLPIACAAAALGCGPGGSTSQRAADPPVTGPPAAVIDAPVEPTVVVAPGGSLRLAGHCTTGPAAHAWDLAGAQPARSASASPGPVRYDVEGTWAIAYRCTVGDATSAAATRTVVVRRPRSSAYALELRTLDPVTDAERAALEAAAARVREVVVGAVPLAHPRGVACAGSSISEDVPGLLVLVRVLPIDGPGRVLGQAGPCAVRASGPPVLGDIELDSADLAGLAATGRLEPVVLHELLHVLGFGTSWEARGLLRGKGGPDPRFTGAAADGAYRDFNGGSAPTVPVENTGGDGTRDGHWRAQVFGPELMTGWLSGAAPPLSRTTVDSLADLGYDVEPLAADPFAVASGVAALFAAPGPDDLVLEGDTLPVEPVVVY